MFYSDDPLLDYERHELEQAQNRKHLPVCDYCEEPIEDGFYYDINGEFVCESCLDRFFKKVVEDD